MLMRTTPDRQVRWEVDFSAPTTPSYAVKKTTGLAQQKVWVRIACVVMLMGATAAKAQVHSATGSDASNVMSDAVAGVRDLQPVIITDKRNKRISAGATGIDIAIKETPQSISVIEQDDWLNFGLSGSNEALALGSGINVEQYETNRAGYNARGFEMQNMLIDGLGTSNEWGTVVGQQDMYVFDKVELIRGANGQLTGIGNASGTVNYVRKRPLNRDAVAGQLGGGSHGLKRAAIDVNKILGADGIWAGRVVLTQENKRSHVRSLRDARSSLYAVADGQIGAQGVLTFGLLQQQSKQRSPMWGSLILKREDGSRVDFDTHVSTSQDWTYWNKSSNQAFAEYSYQLSDAWELKLSANHLKASENMRLLYAFAGNGLKADNTGLKGWPYHAVQKTTASVLDVNLSGDIWAFGREHSVLFGLNHSSQHITHDIHDYDKARFQFLPLPAFPYGGGVYPEPVWGQAKRMDGGRQTLSRIYGAARLQLSGAVHTVLGFNAVKLRRVGSPMHGPEGSSTFYPDIQKVSPYWGLTVALSPSMTAYGSYSSIFQHQDQRDERARFLPPMQGENFELGLKAEWLDKKLLANVAVFGAKQNGFATFTGINKLGQYYYSPQNVTSRGLDLEVVGKLGAATRLTLGLTHLQLRGQEGQKTVFSWIPRTTLVTRLDTQWPGLPALRLGVGGRWQSVVNNAKNGIVQKPYGLFNAFASYAFNDKTTLRLNVNNVLNKKYVHGVQWGANYGAPRNASATLEFNL